MVVAASCVTFAPFIKLRLLKVWRPFIVSVAPSTVILRLSNPKFPDGMVKSVVIVTLPGSPPKAFSRTSLF